jgi:pyridoxal phosphate enzyme (YggS family)
MEFPELPARLVEIRQRIDGARARGGHGQSVRIVAVTKTHGPDSVLAALENGLTDIGENKVQEAVGKQESLAGKAAVTGGMQAVSGKAPIWHLIGHLQRNKVKFLDRFSLFHAMDSERLSVAIDEFGRLQPKPVNVLVEVNVSGETSKHGFSLSQMAEYRWQMAELRGIRVMGVMTMAPLDADEATLRAVFGGAREAREMLRKAGHPASELSMGMSGDYEVAVEEGATMVRLGTLLFGTRNAVNTP